MKSNIQNLAIASIAIAVCVVSAQSLIAQQNYSRSSSSSSSYSYGGPHGSSRSSKVSFDNTSLLDALHSSAELTDKTVLIDLESIQQSGIDLKQSVTADISNKSGLDVLKAILPTGLQLIVMEDQILITLADLNQEEAMEKNRVAKMVDLGVAKAHQSLQKKMPVHFDQAPMEMVVQMIAGMANLRTDMDLVHGGFGLPSTTNLVTIHQDDATLAECLDKVLEQHGKTYSIKNGKLSISDKE